jgi:hypothetical protein
MFLFLLLPSALLLPLTLLLPLALTRGFCLLSFLFLLLPLALTRSGPLSFLFLLLPLTLPRSERLSFVFLQLRCALSCSGLLWFVPLLLTRGFRLTHGLCALGRFQARGSRLTLGLCALGRRFPPRGFCPLSFLFLLLPFVVARGSCGPVQTLPHGNPLSFVHSACVLRWKHGHGSNYGPWPADFLFLSRFGLGAGLVTLRQTFVRRCHGGLTEAQR